MTRAAIHRISLPTPFPVGLVHCYLILGDRPMLVDTGVANDDSWRALEMGLAQHGLAVRDLRRVVLTHGHVDHYGQAARIRDESGAEVLAHARTSPLVAEYPWDLPAVAAANVDFFRQNGAPEAIARGIGELLAGSGHLQRGVPVDLEVGSGARIETSGDRSFTAFEVAGHYPGHLVLYDETERVLIGGDHLLDDGTPVPFLFLKDWDRGIRPRSLVLFLESLARLERLEVDTVLPGHGGFEIPLRLWIERIRKHHARIRGRLLHHLGKGPSTAFDLARRLYRGQLDVHTFLVVSEVVGNLDVLERDGDVELFQDDRGTIRYRATDGTVRARKSFELVLDREGRWLEGGEEITHERTLEMLHRGLRRNGDGWVVEVGGQRRTVRIEDAPYVVQRVEERDGTVVLRLSGGLEAKLDPATLSIGAENVLYATVNGGLRARFSRAAYYQLASAIVEGDDGCFALIAPDGRRHSILGTRGEPDDVACDKLTDHPSERTP